MTLRATALAALTTAPVLQAAQTALTQGLATAAGFGVLILLMSLLLTAQTREMTLASLATMGLRRWQAQLLLAAETLPPVVAAAIGGVACAWLLAPLVGPSLNLAAFSGTGVGHRGDSWRFPAGRFRGRAGAGRAARPGRSGRDHLPSRQRQGAADR